VRILGLVLLIALVGGALTIWLRGRSQPRVDGDLAVIQQLANAGSDLSKPHPIEFFLYFPSEQLAQSAAAQVRQAGFQAKVELGAEKKNWLCLATKSLVPAHAALVAIRAQFEELASNLGGEYDGWGTPVVQ